MGQSDRDDDLDDVAYRHPLPPDDRLWRHPSELDEDAIVEAAAQRSGVSKLLSSLFPGHRH